MKCCPKCKIEKRETDFYSGVGRCKECHKAAVKRRYNERRDEIAAYERKRSATPERRAKALQYQRTRRRRYPEKNAARAAVNNAVRDGRLTRQRCEICGATKVQAHHHDYSKPLDVRWLCFKCHREHEHGHTVNVQT